MEIQKLKSNKGFTTADIIASIIIIIAFISIITTAFYNYYMSIQSNTRQSVATNIMIDVIENIEMLDYDVINNETINNLIQELKNNGTIQEQYQVIATVQKYNEQTGNEQKQDLIKLLNVKVKYTSNKKEETYEITRLITK